jgi:OHCU decarboxylase
MTTVEHLNALDVDGFVASVGFAFEESPWVARAAAAQRPFADREALLRAMVGVVQAASPEEQVALIVAHPDLAGRVARDGRLTASSTSEQAAAGLDQLTPAEVAHFDRANAHYRKRFGFPFVICAREHDKTSVLAHLDRRSANERDTEIATALDEIAKIARLRIEGAVA